MVTSYRGGGRGYGREVDSELPAPCSYQTHSLENPRRYEGGGLVKAHSTYEQTALTDQPRFLIDRYQLMGEESQESQSGLLGLHVACCGYWHRSRNGVSDD